MGYLYYMSNMQASKIIWDRETEWFKNEKDNVKETIFSGSLKWVAVMNSYHWRQHVHTNQVQTWINSNPEA